MGLHSTLFYTFSTISQTGAGMIALLGAFVLYKLQFLNRELDELSTGLIDSLRKSPTGWDDRIFGEFRQHHLRGEFSEVVKKSLGLNVAPGTKKHAKPVQDRMAQLVKDKNDMVRLFKCAGALVAASIILSVCGLPFVEFTADHIKLSMLQLFLVCGPFILGTIESVRLVYKACD